MIVCTECGEHNERGQQFCQRCGTYLEWDSEEVQEQEQPAKEAVNTSTAPLPQEAVPEGPTCVHCGEPDPGDVRYCPRCGNQLHSWPPTLPDKPKPTASPAPRVSPLLLGGVAALLLVAVVAFVSFRGGDEEEPVVLTSTPTIVPLPAPAPETEVDREIGPLEVAGVTASSFLAPDGDVSYAPELVLDGDPSTAWNDGVRGDPVGQWLEFTFAHPVTITEIEIINGYDKVREDGVDLWPRNHRVREMRLTSDGDEQTFALEDTREPQTITVAGGSTCVVRLTVDSVFEGSEFEDVALSDFAFSGRPGGDGECAGETV